MEVLTLWIALTFGGIDGPVLDVGGSVLVVVDHIPGRTLGRDVVDGLTLGPLVLVRRGTGRFPVDHEEVVRHEMKHVRQWEALGPALPIAYALMLGREFEPYLGDGTVWLPEPEMRLPTCPLLRLTNSSASFMPCWRFP